MLSLLFSFRGRIDRGKYWFGMLLVGFASLLGQILVQALASSSLAVAKTLVERLAAYSNTSAILLPLTVITMWASLAVQWKRLHDRGRSGWISLLLPLVVVMMVCTMFTDVFASAPLLTILNNALGYLGIIALISIALFIDLGLLAGQDGPNKYGDPPGPGGLPPNSRTPAPNPAAFLNAQTAIDRAISQRDDRPAAAAAPRAQARPTPQPPALQSTLAPRAFGRRAAR